MVVLENGCMDNGCIGKWLYWKNGCIVKWLYWKNSCIGKWVQQKIVVLESGCIEKLV